MHISFESLCVRENIKSASYKAVSDIYPVAFLFLLLFIFIFIYIYIRKCRCSPKNLGIRMKCHEEGAYTYMCFHLLNHQAFASVGSSLQSDFPQGPRRDTMSCTTRSDEQVKTWRGEKWIKPELS